MRLHRLQQRSARAMYPIVETPQLSSLLLLSTAETRLPGQIFETDWHLFRAYVNSNSLLLEHESRAGRILYEGFLDSLGAMAAKVGGGLKAAGAAVVDSTKKAAETLGQHANAFAEIVSQQIDDIIAWAITNVPNGKVFYDFVANISGNVEGFLDEVFNRAKNALADFVEKGRKLLVDKVIGLVAKDESVKKEIAVALGIDEPLIQKCGQEIEKAEATGVDPDEGADETPAPENKDEKTESLLRKKKIIREAALEGFDRFARKELLGESLNESNSLYDAMMLERDLREFFGDDDEDSGDEDSGDEEEGGEEGGEEGDEEGDEEGGEEEEDKSICGVQDIFTTVAEKIPQFAPSAIMKKGEQGVKNAMKFAGTMGKMFSGELTGGDLEAAARGALATVFEKVFDIWHRLGSANPKRYFEPLLNSELFQRFKGGFMTALGGVMGIAASTDLAFEKVARYIGAIVEGAKARDKEVNAPDGKPYFLSMMMADSAKLLKDLLLGLIRGSNIENVVRGLVGDPTAIKRFIQTLLKSLKQATKKFVQGNTEQMFMKFFGKVPFADKLIPNAAKLVDPIFAGIDKMLPD